MTSGKRVNLRLVLPSSVRTVWKPLQDVLSARGRFITEMLYSEDIKTTNTSQQLI